MYQLEFDILYLVDDASYGGPSLDGLRESDSSLLQSLVPVT